MSACKRNFDLNVRIAARWLHKGGVVAHATEGVWGLACDPHDAMAVGRILRLKGRAPGKGLILIGADADDFGIELAELAPDVAVKVRASWPGAVTWLLPNRRYPDWITGGRATVACRVPGHPQSRALCRAFDGPLVSTSANPSGRPPAVDSLKARRWLQGRVDFLVPGATLGRRGPSEIRTPDGSRVR